MLFWFLAGLLTLGASLAVLLPLARWRGDGDGVGHDVEVYRDQLAELDRDRARGLIPASEAEEARAEIARRLLKADAEARRQESEIRSSRLGRIFAVAAVLSVPLLSWSVYATIGSPELPSQPLAERLARDPSENSVDELIARAESHLAANPNDGRGWDVLAPIYARLGRYEQAAGSYRNAIRLDGASAVRESGLGEALAGVAGGIVSSDALAAFRRALEIEPGHPKARFYIATGLAQEGKTAEAIAAWQAMLAELPADSPWRGAVGQALAEAERALASAKQAPGPNQADTEAAASMSQQDRAAMIETMVASLDARLRDNPKDAEGWIRLVRSYLVLGRADDARDALRRADEALGPGSEQALGVRKAAEELGILSEQP